VAALGSKVHLAGQGVHEAWAVTPVGSRCRRLNFLGEEQMSNEVIARRLTVLSEILTPTGRYRNQVARIGNDFVEVVSERSRRRRRISFQDIRNESTSNGCIIASFRQILGLDSF
jgi:hypothetical protein